MSQVSLSLLGHLMRSTSCPATEERRAFELCPEGGASTPAILCATASLLVCCLDAGAHGAPLQWQGPVGCSWLARPSTQHGAAGCY